MGLLLGFYIRCWLAVFLLFSSAKIRVLNFAYLNATIFKIRVLMSSIYDVIKGNFNRSFSIYSILEFGFLFFLCFYQTSILASAFQRLISKEAMKKENISRFWLLGACDLMMDDLNHPFFSSRSIIWWPNLCVSEPHEFHFCFHLSSIEIW